MSKGKFLITIDTEGDNLWTWKPGGTITTENVLYLERFQGIAEKYGFKPVWLTNYEMIMDDRYVVFIKNVVARNAGELGMHLHAWNQPPFYNLPLERNGQPYLIEYPTEIMEYKINALTKTIEERTGIRPISHRAGRWATDKRYFSLLQKYGYQVDCSVTPHKNWSSYPGQTKGSKGSDYSKCSGIPFLIPQTAILEVPVSIVLSHKPFRTDKLIKIIRDVVIGRDLWLRPGAGHENVRVMKYVLSQTQKSGSDYVMLMLHSSEMMPGGSPTFPDNLSIEEMYRNLEIIFEIASEDFEGCTLEEYSKNIRNKKVVRNKWM